MRTDLRVAMLVLAACSAAPTALTPASSAPTTAPQATQQPLATPTQAGSMAGMDHGSMNANAPFAAMFIDGMVVHHEGAIAMANDALQKAQRPEIKTLAGDIIEAQQAEIAQMQQWRTAWYPDLKDTGGMMTPGGRMMDMGPMSVAEGDAPYDIRFIEAMIPHHESAIAMAQEAKQKSERAEIKQLADQIIKAQQAEIAQIKQWRAEWFE